MDSFDYIIVGAGAAGCVLANRLSTDQGKKILLLEAGGTDNSIWISIPAGFRNLLDHPKFNWRFQTVPEDGVRGRSIPIPRGKVIGGSSSINGMLYVRGQARDYDHWAQLGNQGWSFNEILPYFRKTESFERGADEWRGGEGPLNVADMTEHHPLVDAFVQAGVESGHERNPDYNGVRQDGFGYYQVTQRRGRRVSAADAYLKPIGQRHNLSVVTGARTKRLIVEGKRVCGIVYDVGGVEREARAGLSVLLCAGAVQSPQLLELSGIGQPELLRNHGIKVRHPLPGVGENYRDHYAARVSWRVTHPATLNEQSRGPRLLGEVLKYAFSRRGILTFTAGIGHGFVRTCSELETPDCQFFFAHGSLGDANTRALEKEPGMTIGVSQLRPESLGSIHISSSIPFATPGIRPNFLSNPLDQKTLTAGLKIARQLGDAPALSKYVAHELNPRTMCGDDEALLKYARQTGTTIYHAMGTCKMGTDDDPMAVVDHRLRIRGLSGLHVVDASVMPTMPSGNINAAVYMVAEKGADMIIEDTAQGS